jgi:PhnB protein
VPRPEFAADLRRQLLDALGITGGTMTTTTSVNATGLIPYICVSPAADAIAFYRDAFGATETLRVSAPDGRIGHAEITIGSVRIMLSDEYAEIGVLSPKTLGGSGFALYLEVDDCDAVYGRAIDAGATSEREPADQTHGNRTATLRDPFGHRWMISQSVEDLTLDEYREREEGWDVTGTPDA